MEQEKEQNEIQKRLCLLRSKMQEEGIDYYLIPTTDFHNSEYVSDFFQTREFFSGFTGSNGSLLVWKEGAGLWTDGRYFIQAEKELLGSGITLFRMQEEGVPAIAEFLEQQMKKGQTLSFDGRVVTAEYGSRLEKILSARGALVQSGKDLAEDIWENRPALPANPVFLLGEEITGESTERKLQWLRESLGEVGADAVFLTKLDEIMWLFNLRGSDVECNPVALSYAYVTSGKAWLFLQRKAAFGQDTQGMTDTPGSEEAFRTQGVTVKEYGQVFSALQEEFAEKAGQKIRVLLDNRNVSFAVYRLFLEAGVCIINGSSPVEARKAVKNTTELERMRKIYLKDSVAVTKFIYWVKKTIKTRRITEAEAAEYLDNLRRAIPEFLELSFPTISAYGENAAMMHYEATQENNSELQEKGMLLVDSGGQYLGGTTDVTRTILLGEISEEIKEQYSAVTAGMLGLLQAVFMKGCTGRNLDILAREPLWKLYRDYKCGTGHGVGYILNVHEGPHSIRWKYVKGVEETVLCPGMTVTDEPGIYIEGSHGIRIENVLVVKPICKNEDGEFFGFENLTFVPIDKAAVKKEYLSEEAWRAFREYQKEVYQRISPYLTEEEAQWLKEETAEW